jgi:hypothetical protein
MGPLLVRATVPGVLTQEGSRVLSLLNAFGHEGVELSIGPPSGVIGALVGTNSRELVQRLCAEWVRCGAGPNDALTSFSWHSRLRFVRIDVSSTRWTSATVYANIVGTERGVGVSPSLESARVSLNSSAHHSTYYDVRGCTREVLDRATRALGDHLAFNREALEEVRRLWDLARSVGWLQSLAESRVDRRLKLGVVPTSRRAALEFMVGLNWSEGADRVRAFLHATGGGPLGYLGVSVDSVGRSSWRAYARAVRCTEVAPLVSRVLDGI